MKDKILTFCLAVAMLGVWQLIYLLYHFESILLPDPITLTKSLVFTIHDKEIFTHILLSLMRVLIGFFSAIFAGVTLALFFGYFGRIGRIFSPLIELIRPIPPIAWIPVAILLFGLGDASAIFIVFLGAFFPIFTNSYFGVQSLPDIYRNVSKTFEVKNLKFVFKILLPYSLTYIFAGIKIGIGMAWMSVIAAELIGAQSGLGYFIQVNRLLLNIDKVIIGMMIIGITGYCLVYFISLLEVFFIPWKPKKYAGTKEY